MRHQSILLAATLAVSGFAFSTNGFAAPKVAEDPAIAAREKADKAAAKEQEKADKAEKKADAREAHELKKMPKVVQETIAAETKGGTDFDYYKLAGAEKVFGVTFKDAKGEPVDVRVDRQGKVISRLNGAAAVAATGAPAITPAAQPAPGTPATPTPPAAPAAIGEFDTKKGDVQYDQLPAPVKASITESIRGGHDIRFYKAMQGATPVYDARFVAANGKDMSVRVDQAGKIVSSKEVTEDAVTAGATEAAGPGGEARPGGYTHIGELPAAPQAAARKLVEGGREPRFFKTENGYDVKWIGTDGVDHSAHVDAAGKVSEQKSISLTASNASQDVGFWDLPDNVRATARKETKEGKNAKYSRALMNGARIWKIRYETADKKDVELRVDDAGKVVSTHELTDKDKDNDKDSGKDKPKTSSKDTSKK